MSSFSKWYFDDLASGQYPPFVPSTARGTWNFVNFNTPGSANSALHPYKSGERIQPWNVSSQTSLGNYRAANQRLISLPLAAQTISGTLSIKIGGREANAAANYFLSMYLYVTVGDTNVVRGVLLSQYDDVITEFTPSGAVVSLSGIALSSLAIQDGDRLVLEVGYINTSVDNISRSGGVYIGTTIPSNYDVAPDLTTDPTIQAGYIQFSSALPVLADPPINANVNTAIELVLDTDTTPDITLAVEGEVWYKHTTASDERVFSAFIYQLGVSALLPGCLLQWFTQSAGLNVPLVVVNYEPPPTDYSFDFANCLVTIPTAVSTTYYFRVSNSATNVNNSITNPVNIRLRTFANKDVPIGSLYISDDTLGYGGVAIDPNTGEILRYFPDFPPGERGIILPVTGLGTFEGFNGDDVVLIDRELNVTDTISGVFTHDQHNIGLYEPACTTDIDGAFYWFQYEDATHFKLTKLSGTAIGTTWLVPRPGGALGNIGSIGISPDKTYLYWNLESNNTTIYRYNLLTSSAASDFAADIATFNTLREALLVNPDGTVYLGLSPTGGTGSGEIRKFSPLGVDLGSIWSFVNANYSFNRIKASSSPTGYIIVWLFDISNGTPNGWALNQIYVIDGSGNQISHCTTYNMAKGVAERNSIVGQRGAISPTDPPPVYGGNSNSCTIIQLALSVAPPTGTGSITVIKITVPSPDPSAKNFDFTTTGGLSPATFDLMNGESQVYSSLPAGVYSITEAVPAGWAVLYEVSNGDSPSEINLEDGESITVTITNTLVEATNTSSGMYRIVPEKRQDTLWRAFGPRTIKDVKIPDPFIKTGLIGK